MGKKKFKCPKCGTVFQINETDYESIAKQIKDHEFEKELTQREEQYKKDKEEGNLEKEDFEMVKKFFRKNGK